MTIHGADPHHVTDATGARFEYLLCTPRSGPADATIGIDDESALRKECRTLVAADGWQNGTQRVGGDVRIRVRP